MSSSEALSSNDLVVYAQDTFNEVLGWYGLYTTSTTTSTLTMTSCSSAGQAVVRTSAARSSMLSHADEGEGHQFVGADHPLDLTCNADIASPDVGSQLRLIQALRLSQHQQHQQQVKSSAARAAAAAAANTAASAGKKLIGIRYLFPAFDERTTLLDRARVWVARHDHKYFVDWNQEQLLSVDPALRPLAPISRDVYKLHMNRSEYCRNVKLKYCLVSDAPWAKAFREKLAKQPSEGGFTGLCQAKIAAAELWRSYSEHYRSHQARHPGTSVSRHQPHHQQQQQQHQVKPRDTSEEPRRPGSTDTEHVSPVHQGQSLSDEIVGDDGQIARSPDEHCEIEEVSRTESRLEIIDEGSIASNNSNNNDDDADDEFDMDGVEVSGELSSGNAVWYDIEDVSGDVSPRSSSSVTPVRSGTPRYGSATLTEDHSSPVVRKSAVKIDRNGNENSKTTMTSDINEAPMTVPLQLDAASTALHGQQVSPSTERRLYDATLNTSSTSPNSAGSVSPSKAPKKSPGERQSSSADYRRSERGLSFLFPSFSDHGISLLDKVRITVARHKNNYFLGWTADQLSRLDPVVRPKVPVTPAIYREYCHRNAMKYDSNLQFACESPESWAAEFRARLTLPPAEGGFSSLCEVKLEAGRLWREHSGRYRMHNIVKWQMGMNSAVLANGSAAAAVAATMKPGRTRGKTSPSSKVDLQSPVDVSSLGQNHLSTSVAGHSRVLDGISPSVLTTSALTVTAPSSLPINLNPFFVSPICTSPRLVAQRCITSNSAAAEQTSLCDSSLYSDALDMSASAAASSDAGPLFEPLPDDMPAADQLRVWLERHRSRYFVDVQPPTTVTGSSLDYVRPRRWPITSAVLTAQIPAGVIEVLGKIDHVLSLPVDALPTLGRRFRERLSSPAGADDAFVTFEQAVTEGLAAWSAVVVGQVEEVHRTAGSGGDAPRRRKRKRSRPECSVLDSSASYGHASGTTSATTAQKPPNYDNQPVDSGTSNDDIEDGVALPPSPTQRNGGISTSVSVEAVQKILWSSRSALHDACAQNQQLSWAERLESVRPTLTSNLGPDYVIPSQGHTAAVDLVLAVLHDRLDDLADSQSCQGHS